MCSLIQEKKQKKSKNNLNNKTKLKFTKKYLKMYNHYKRKKKNCTKKGCLVPIKML